MPTASESENCQLEYAEQSRDDAFGRVGMECIFLLSSYEERQELTTKLGLLRQEPYR